jgi:drug/metabolite transporter (DMT)-like permease
LWQERGRAIAAVRAIGWPGLAAAGLSALATLLFINAFRRTTVADVTIIYAAAPFVTAAIDRLWLGTRTGRSTLAASAVALIGVAVMMRAALSAGHLAGNLLALGMTLCMSLMMVIIRHHRAVPMLPAASLSALLSALATWPVAAPGSAGSAAIGWLLLFGITQFGLGLLLLTLGTRLVSAAEAALLGSLDAPLAPLWVWLAFDEVPPAMTCLGGVIVMAAVAGHLLLSRPAPSPSPSPRPMPNPPRPRTVPAPCPADR